MADLDEIVERLRSIDEELSELAIGRLRASLDGDPEAAADEKRITRARRAVEKAVHLLDNTSSQENDL